MQSIIRRPLRAAPLLAVPLALLVSLALFTAPAVAQTGTIQGRVTTAGSGDPVLGARVALVGTNVGTQTDDDGRFVLLNVPVGTQQLQVLLIGYAMGTLQLRVRPGVVTPATMELNTSVLRLDEIVVTGTAGQARRRQIPAVALTPPPAQPTSTIPAAP